MASPINPTMTATGVGMASEANTIQNDQHYRQTRSLGMLLAGTQQQAQELVLRASEDDLRIAVQRLAIIRPWLNGQQACAEPMAADTQSPVSVRTLRNWKANYQKAERLWGSGFIGLIPQWSCSGNRTRRLGQTTIDLMSEVIEEHYENIKRKHIKIVYGELVLQCEEKGLTAPDYKTFREEIRRRPQYQQTVAREGKRAAYGRKQFYWELELTTPRHGERPLEMAHLDHTTLDIELSCSKTGQVLGRPWATFLVDAFSRRILAILLTFDPPSYRSCMMILRECVRRHNRLPQTVIVDNGREFESVYFEALLARYECTKKSRPYAEPHFGSVCERLFGTSNTQFVHNLTGNTQATKQARTMTMTTDPRRHANWTLSTLHECLCEWAYEVYEQIDHPALGQSPRQAYEIGLSQSGCRPQMGIKYDQDFVLTTLPSTPKGSAQIHPSHGITLNHIDYWSDAFLDPRYAYTRVAVRYDPFNAGIAFAYVGQRWVRCIGAHYAELQGRSERELALMAQELRRQHELLGRKFKVTAAQLARFIRIVESKEPDSAHPASHATIRQQRLKDNESNQVMAYTEALTDPVLQPPIHIAESNHIIDDSPSDAQGVADSTETASPIVPSGSKRVSKSQTVNPMGTLESFGDY